MASTDSKKLVEAVSAVHAALEPLDTDARDRVINSVMTLLGMSSVAPPQTTHAPDMVAARARDPDPVAHSRISRPLSLVELLQEKEPASNTQRLALFAFYREKVEELPRLSRADLKNYFELAKLVPSSNYDRDFTAVVKLGWIHEDGDDSYLTTKGLEAVEAGFGGKQLPRGPSTKKETKKKGAKRKTRRKKRG